jgi:hypothetical protein
MVCTVCHGSGVMPLTDSPSRTFRRFMARTINFRLPCQACNGTGHRPDPVSDPPPPQPDRKQQLHEKRSEILQTLKEAKSVPLSAPTLSPDPCLFGSLSPLESAFPVPTGRSSSGDDVPVETEEQLRRKAFRVIQDALGGGEIGVEEAGAYGQALKDLFAAADQPVSSPEAAEEQASAMHEVISSRKHIFIRQGLESGSTPKGTASPAKLAHRAESLLELLEPLKNYLAGELNRVKQGAQENELGLKLLEDLSRAMQSLRKAADSGEARRIEHYQLRSLPLAIRNYGLRYHIMVAQPFWGAAHVEPDPTSIFFAGGARIESDLFRFCKKRNLQLKTAADPAGTGHLRWSLTRESVVGVYDLTSNSQCDRASVCHALGVGLARGIYPVVIAEEGAALPFDIDVDTLYLRPPAFDTSSIAKRLDQALFGLHLPSGERSIRATAAHLPDSRTLSDPVELERRLRHDLSGDSALLQPVWPPSYPVSSEKSCFHIMPFSQPWSAQVRDKVRRGVERGGLRYSRGDQAKKTHIVRAIWDEICRSSCVIADLTGLNENVCLELGLAQAVGRPALLLSHDKPDTRLFPEITKIQVRRYSPNGADLRRLIGAWLPDL